MDRIYKIGGHCFALPDERLMEAVDGISGFKPFSWQPDLVSAKDVYEGGLVAGFYEFGRETVGIFRLLREVLWVRI